MSANYGPRATGTDGSDHWHRESVAWQYRISSINKSRLKMAMFFHGLLSLVMLVRLVPGMLTFWGVRQPRFMMRWNLPPPQPWEYAWFVSTVSIIFGGKSLAKNKTPLLWQFIIGTLVFGLLPVIYGAIEQTDELSVYLKSHKIYVYIFRYPAVIVWYFFFMIAAQIHIFSLYFSYKLMKAWQKVTRDVKVKVR